MSAPNQNNFDFTGLIKMIESFDLKKLDKSKVNKLIALIEEKSGNSNPYANADEAFGDDYEPESLDVKYEVSNRDIAQDYILTKGYTFLVRPCSKGNEWLAFTFLQSNGVIMHAIIEIKENGYRFETATHNIVYPTIYKLIRNTLACSHLKL
jgi:hypothetical protein